MTHPLRIVFMGTPEFACPSLQALVGAGHDVRLVVTQPDRPVGRKLMLTAPPVKTLALALGLPVHQPKGVRKPENAQPILDAAPEGLDAIIVAAYGRILPRAILDFPKYGCVNVHASLLPRWRGAAPIHAAILAGDVEAGVTIMQMSEGLDEGDMLLKGAVSVAPGETQPTLHDKLAPLGARLLVEALEKIASGTITRTPQPTGGVTFAPPIKREDGFVDFAAKTADEIERMIRGYDPWPGVWAELEGPKGRERVRLVAAHPGPSHAAAPAGQVIGAGKAGITIACGNNTTLTLSRLQRPGKSDVDAGAFLNGWPLTPGARFIKVTP